MRRILRYASLPSTMPEAARLAAEGCESGTAVVAAEQTAGVGRHGHSWYSAPGTGLYVSVVLRVPPAPVLTLALGLAAGEAIENVAAVSVDLRWPNDLMIRERKAAGILVETTTAGVIVAGIGINVNQRSFPPDLAHDATSLYLETGREYSVDALLDALLAWIEHYSVLPSGEILERFASHSSYVRGKRVVVDGVEGVTDGLDEAGFLILRRPDGTRTTILAGGVRPV